jgi:hypothetical protein
MPARVKNKASNKTKKNKNKKTNLWTMCHLTAN